MTRRFRNYGVKPAPQADARTESRLFLTFCLLSRLKSFASQCKQAFELLILYISVSRRLLSGNKPLVLRYPTACYSADMFQLVDGRFHAGRFSSVKPAGNANRSRKRRGQNLLRNADSELDP